MAGLGRGQGTTARALRQHGTATPPSVRMPLSQGRVLRLPLARATQPTWMPRPTEGCPLPSSRGIIIVFSLLLPRSMGWDPHALSMPLSLSLSSHASTGAHRFRGDPPLPRRTAAVYFLRASSRVLRGPDFQNSIVSRSSSACTCAKALLVAACMALPCTAIQTKSSEFCSSISSRLLSSGMPCMPRRHYSH